MVEAEVRDIREVLRQHVTIAGQLERSAVMLDVVIDVLTEFSPRPSVQAGNVGAIEIQ